MRATGSIRAYQSGLLPFEVDVYLNTYDGPGWIRRVLRGRCGWLRVSRATMTTPISDWTATLCAAVTDDGLHLGPFASSAFLDMRSSNPRETLDDPAEELDGVMEMRFWDFLGSCDLKHLRMLREIEAEIAARIAAEQARGEKVLADADALIANLRRQRRDPNVTPERRAQLAETISFFEERQSAAAAWLVRRLASMRETRVQLETDVLESLEDHGEVEELYTVRWIARHAFDRIFAPPEGNFLMGGLHHPFRNDDAERSLRRRRLIDDERDDERRDREARERERRLAAWEETRKGRAVAMADAAARRAAEELVAREMARANAAPLPKVKHRVSHPTPTPVVEPSTAPPSRNSLLTKAQRASAEPRDDKRDRDDQVAALLLQYPTIALLDARLERVPSTGIENRRLARLIRLAIRQVSGRDDPEQEPAAAGEEEDDT